MTIQKKLEQYCIDNGLWNHEAEKCVAAYLDEQPDDMKNNMKRYWQDSTDDCADIFICCLINGVRDRVIQYIDEEKPLHWARPMFDPQGPLTSNNHTIMNSSPSTIWINKLCPAIWADLPGADLTEADLSGADLSGADLTGAKLTGADLTGAKLTGADLSGAKLSGADLTGADLTGAKLSGADLTEADLIGANLTGADLTGADLTEANVSV